MEEYLKLSYCGNKYIFFFLVEEEELVRFGVYELLLGRKYYKVFGYFIERWV